MLLPHGMVGEKDKEDIDMAVEIERKFLVRENWKPKGAGVRIAQGYLSREPMRTVRVRVKGKKGYLTVKGKNEGIRRAEFEYEVPLADAEAMLALCAPPIIEKRRYIERIEGFRWEIDVFAGENEGLCVAEIELSDENVDFPLPPWAGEEVSGDARYYNSQLARVPYRTWSRSQPRYPQSHGFAFERKAQDVEKR